MFRVKEEILDKMAELEVMALIEGLNDPELRKQPSFLEKVRKFLKDNKLETTIDTGMKVVETIDIKEIPEFDDDV